MALSLSRFLNVRFSSRFANSAVSHNWEGLRNPPKTADELLATLEGQGLLQTVFEPESGFIRNVSALLLSNRMCYG
jgi:hypothetical protein